METIMWYFANNLEVAKEELISFVSSFDADMSGDNGEEHTFEEALKLGYKSTIEHLVGESSATSVEGLIDEVLTVVVATYEDCGGACYGFIFDEASNQYAISFTYC